MPRKSFLKSVLLAGLLLAPATGALADSSDSVKLLVKGRQAYRAGKIDDALDLFRRSVRSDPGNDEARFELGAVLLRTGQTLPAEQQLRQSLRSGKLSEGKVLPVLAATLLADHRYKELLELTGCVTDLVCRADLLGQQARADLALGDQATAVTVVAAALKMAPDSISARFAQAMLQNAQGQWEQSEHTVDAVLALKPKLPEALALKGELRGHAGDLKGAVAALRASVDNNPNDVNIQIALVMALLTADREKDADQEIDRMLDKGASVEPQIDVPDVGSAPQEIADAEDERLKSISSYTIMGRYLKSMLLVRAKRLPEALDMIRPVEVQVGNAVPRGTYLLAVIHSGNGQMEQALQYAATFNDSFPDNLAGTLLLANINFAIGAYHRVIDILEPLHDRIANDGEALSVLGSAYLAEGRIENANRTLSDSLQVRPSNALTKARLAISKTERPTTYDQGLQELEDLVKSNPNDPRIDLSLVATHFASGDYVKAAAAAEEMARHQPTSPLPLVLHGEAEIEQGDPVAARGDFQAALDKSPDYSTAVVVLASLDMRLGESAQARTVLDAFLKRQPADLSALLARADLERHLGAQSAAIPYLRRAVASHPKQAEPHMALLQVLLAQGDRTGALREAEELGAHHADNGMALNLAATTCVSIGQTEAGLRMFRDLESRYPNSAVIAHRYGQLLAAVGRFSEARAEYARAVAETPDYLPAWIDFTLVERHLGGFETALDVAHKAEAHNPNSDVAALLRGDLFRVAGKLHEAETAYREVLKKWPTPAVMSRIFVSILQQGDRPRAMEAAEAWLKAHPDDLRIQLEIGDAYMSAGVPREAAAHYAQVVQRVPRDATALNNLAWAYARLDDPQALEIARHAYVLAPGSPQILDTYAYLQYRKGDAKVGMDLILQAYGLAPTNPEIALHMAMLLAEQNNPKEALMIVKALVDSKVAFGDQEEARKLKAKLESQP